MPVTAETGREGHFDDAADAHAGATGKSPGLRLQLSYLWLRAPARRRHSAPGDAAEEPGASPRGLSGRKREEAAAAAPLRAGSSRFHFAIAPRVIATNSMRLPGHFALMRLIFPALRRHLLWATLITIITAHIEIYRAMGAEFRGLMHRQFCRRLSGLLVAG